MEEHNHEHSHNYTHSHPHDHSNGEGHDHHHDHEHEHHDHDGALSGDKLVALMKYMVSHNEDHAHELEHLAAHMKEAGNLTAYEVTMDAIRFYDSGNATLKKALGYLEK